jgi:hypothetical protein
VTHASAEKEHFDMKHVNKLLVRSKRSHHLEQGEVTVGYIVEVDLGVYPGVIEMRESYAIVFGRHDIVVYNIFVSVNAVLESAHEQIYAHDTEDKPEHQTDKEHVEDRRYCLYQSIDDNLETEQCIRLKLACYVTRI